jgi:hypothetical protein
MDEVLFIGAAIGARDEEMFQSFLFDYRSVSMAKLQSS